MLSPLSERSRLHLHRAGYGVAFRSQEWSECLISRADERWLGHGALDDEAFNDALRQMLPSRLARELFQAQLASSPEEQASAEPAAAREDTPSLASEDEPPSAGEDTPPLAATALTEEAAAATAAPEESLPAEPIEATASIEAPPVVEIAAPPPPPPPPPSPTPLPEAAEIAGPAPRAAATEPDSKTISLAEALSALEKMLRDIDEDLPKLAKKSAERQRSHLLAWICRARAFEEA